MMLAASMIMLLIAKGVRVGWGVADTEAGWVREDERLVMHDVGCKHDRAADRKRGESGLGGSRHRSWVGGGRMNAL